MESDWSRRLLLGATASLGALAAMPVWAKEHLTPTPAATAGPFYPRQFPADGDADLVRVAGRSGRARGIVVLLQGSLATTDGRPVEGGEIEIWQCDAGGIYHHVGHHSAGADPNFQGYGKTRSGPDGSFRFRTIKPVAYPGRTPHIHAIVSAPGGARLTTQLYVAGEAQNDRDFLYRQLRDPEARAAVTLDFRPAPHIEAGALLARPRLVLPA